jgi:hypothetical protein
MRDLKKDTLTARSLPLFVIAAIGLFNSIAREARAEDTTNSPKAFIDGIGTGWHPLEFKDFAHVNCKPETWTSTNGMIHCTGTPMGVIRTEKVYTNFELVAQWRHLKYAGNSGIFVWATPESIKELEEGKRKPFPSGIEVQILDHGYKEQYERNSKKKADWFTTDGDLFPVGSTKMKPFAPISPDGSRSFPSKHLSKGVDQWNHYYVRAINGEIRLWVNGEEVSGGSDIQPASGYLCLESEGAPIDFKEIRIRELP